MPQLNDAYARHEYDWHKGTTFFGGLVTGEEMRALETRGKAKRFKMTGDWTGTVSGVIELGPDGTLGEIDLDWQPRVVLPGP